MKKRTKRTTGSHLIQPGEHVRVVPLHHPKPYIPIDEIARRRREPKDQELFDGKPHPLLTPAHLTYNGGPLITNVQIFTVFWGKKWGASTASTQLIQKLNQFFAAIVV